MSQPRINHLEPQTGPQRNKMSVLLKSKTRGAGAISFLTQAEVDRLFVVITKPRESRVNSWIGMSKVV